jgi:hypothetical protein
MAEKYKVGTTLHDRTPAVIHEGDSVLCICPTIPSGNEHAEMIAAALNRNTDACSNLEQPYTHTQVWEYVRSTQMMREAYNGAVWAIGTPFARIAAEHLAEMIKQQLYAEIPFHSITKEKYHAKG